MGLIILRVLAVITGFLLLYVSIFLYENEEKKIQNKIEELWLRLSYNYKSLINPHLAFLQNAARTTHNWVQRLYGEKTKSWKFVSTSILLSLGLFSLAMEFSAGDFSKSWIRYITGFIIYFLPVILSIKYPRFSKTRNTFAVLALLLLFLSFLFLQRAQMANSIMGFSSLIGIGLLCDMIVINYFQKLLARASMATETIVFIKTLFLFVIFSVVSLTVPFILTYVLEVLFTGLSQFTRGPGQGPIGIDLVYEIPDSQKIYFISINLLTIVPLLILSAIALTYLIHILIWPLLLRLFYNFQRTGMVNNKKTAFIFGVALISFSFDPTLVSVKSILELFGVDLPKP